LILKKKLDWFFKNICTTKEREPGCRLSYRTATAELVANILNGKEIRTYYDRWVEMLGGPYDETVEILHGLKQKNR